MKNVAYKIMQCSTSIREYGILLYNGTVSDFPSSSIDRLLTPQQNSQPSTCQESRKPCNSHADCNLTSGDFCQGGQDFFCPNPKGFPQANFTYNQECWRCPEYRTSGLVNPKLTQVDALPLLAASLTMLAPLVSTRRTSGSLSTPTLPSISARNASAPSARLPVTASDGSRCYGYEVRLQSRLRGDTDLSEML